MENTVELKLIGITYNQIESGVYALLLEEPLSKKRLAIVIGYPEAQSIECHLQNVRTPRPLSHDVMAQMIKSLKANLTSIYIHKLPAGPYAGKLNLIDEIGRQIVIDARSSDAIALAIRMGSPIFTSLELLEKEGFIADKLNPKISSVSRIEPDKNGYRVINSVRNYSKMSDEALLEALTKAVTDENYEEAAKIKAELERRSSNLND